MIYGKTIIQMRYNHTYEVKIISFYFAKRVGRHPSKAIFHKIKG